MQLTMKEKIMVAAEKRVRGAGFAEMSFRDLAGDVGIKSASVHYHFPTKADLGEALVVRYAEQFKDKMDQIQMDDLTIALEGFVGLYSDALVLDECICLCAILGAEAIGLPENVNSRTKAFFEMNQAWLKSLFKNHNVENAGDTASLIVAALEGGMIVASASNSRGLFEAVARGAVRAVIKR